MGTRTLLIPTPDSHFGHAIGVDRELLDWDGAWVRFRIRNIALAAGHRQGPGGLDIVLQLLPKLMQRMPDLRAAFLRLGSRGAGQ